MSKTFHVYERKHGVSIHIEDANSMYRDTINLSWQELAGLHWAMQDCLKNPNFKAREPRERKNKGGVQREFVKHIELVEPE